MKNTKNIFLDNIKISKISFGNNPDKDWVLLCVASFLLLILIVLWNTFLFFSLNNERENQNIWKNDVSSTNSAILINKKTLSDLLFRYDKKQKDFENLKSFKNEMPDPGL